MIPYKQYQLSQRQSIQITYVTSRKSRKNTIWSYVWEENIKFWNDLKWAFQTSKKKYTNLQVETMIAQLEVQMYL